MHKKITLLISVIVYLFSQISYGQQFQFMHDDSMRSYVVYEPPLDPNPNGYPLIIGLHGTGSDAYGIMGTAALVNKANEEQFIVACPNALQHNLFTYFNAGGGYEELTNGLDDVGFLSALIDTMIKNYQIDTTRIYILGHSNGGIMAYRMAAQLSHKIAAIGSNAGPMTYEYCNPEFPVPIIHVHGLSDPLIPFEGGVTIIYYPPADSILGIWREINGCSSTPDTIYNESKIFGRKWASVSGKSDIVLYTIEDMPHKWSRPSNYGLPTTDVMWDFLKIHSRDKTTGIEQGYANAVPKNIILRQNYPNPFNPSTTIKYILAESSHIKLKIYNLAGQEVASLVNKFQTAGDYEIVWTPKRLQSGLYLCKIQAGDFLSDRTISKSGPYFSETKKLILQK
jgi:polyhydroxybutyrate depolymerase